jgi:polysaccharide chain length determinant protein (PEP-CTERM system associated)
MNNPAEFDLNKYLDIAKKYKWYGVIPALTVMLLLTFAASFLPLVFESTCIVEVDRGLIENPLRRGNDRLPGLGEHLAVFSENALKWDILSEVAGRVGMAAIEDNSDILGLNKFKQKLGLTNISATDSGDARAEKEAIVAILKDGIRFRQKPPKFLLLTYQGVHSDVNAKILNTLVTILIEEEAKSDIQEAGRNYEFIESELENYRKKLEEAEANLKDFKEKHISELPNDANINLTQLTNDKSELLSCELEMKELTSRVQYLDDQLKKQDELVVSEVRRGANPMLTVLNQRIVDMEIELTRMRTNYTELHPRVIELKGQIEDLKRQREAAQDSTVNSETSMLNPVYQRLVQDRQETLLRTEVLGNRIANLEKRIAENEEKVKSMPAQEQELVTLTRNYDVTANIYNMLLQRREEVRIQEKLASEEKSKESFRVMQYARATQIPVAPEKKKLAAFILLASLGSGIGLMLALNFFDDSLNTAEEAKEFIGLPLLGTIPLLHSKSNNGHHSLLKRVIETREKVPLQTKK